MKIIQGDISTIEYEARKNYLKFVSYSISRVFISTVAWLSFFTVIWLWVLDVFPVDLWNIAALLTFGFFAVGAMPPNPDYKKDK